MIAALLLLLTACASPTRSSSGPATDSPGLSGVGELPAPASAWPAAQYDARHSSASTATGPQSGTVRWSVNLGGNLTPGPVIGIDGSIVQAGNSGVIYDLDPRSGEVVWSFDGGASYGSDLSTSPAVLSDGTILWPGPNSTLYALSSAGVLLWKETFAGQLLSPAVAGRDRVYVVDSAGRLSALVVTASEHRRLWTLDLHGSDYASPSVGPDGTIYTAVDQDLVAVRDLGSTGRERWRFHAEKQIEVGSGVSPDGIVVLGTNDDFQYGIRPDGSVAWRVKVHAWVYSSSTVTPEGVAYFGDNSGRLHVIDTGSGKVLRTISPKVPKREHIWTSIVVDAKGNTYWASTRGRVYGYDSTGIELFTTPIDAGSNAYPALGADGTLYVGTTAGTLFAIGGG